MEPQANSRDAVKRQYWQQQISNWKASGLSQKQFCKNQSVALSTFCYWKVKISKSEPSGSRFYPLTIPSFPETFADAGLRLLVGTNRFQIELKENFSAAALMELIPLLEKL